MPINRKLQSEMDRTFKRVAEGQAAFEELWQKLDAMEVPYSFRHPHSCPYAECAQCCPMACWHECWHDCRLGRLLCQAACAAGRCLHVHPNIVLQLASEVHRAEMVLLCDAASTQGHQVGRPGPAVLPCLQQGMLKMP